MIVSEEVRRIERKLERINRTARFVRWKPQPPREVGFSDGLLSWKPPEDALGTTHYRIYKNNENNLVRQVPVGQLQIEDNLVAERIFISSWNEPAGKESRLVQLGERVTPGGTIGNVSINNAVVTWEDVDGNGNIDLKATVSYDAPDPLGSFDRVRVYIERSDGTIVGGETDFPYDGTDPETVYTFTAPPEASDTWRVYVLSGSATAWNRLVLYGSANATPSYEILVGPPPEGSSGSEWTSNVSSLTASVEYAVTVVGDLVFRIYGTYVEPSDPTYYGARMVGRYDGDDFQLSYEPRGNTAYTSRWYPVPDVSQNWTIYAQSQGPDYRFNSIIPGTTPSASVTIQDQVGVGGLDLTRVNVSTFNTDEFEIDPTEGFQVNILNATKIQTGILKVGGGSNKPGQMGVFDGTEQLIGWIGQSGAYYGGWMKQLWVGGTDPSTAPLYTNSSGQLVIKSTTGDGVVQINPTTGFYVNQSGYTPFSNRTSYVQPMKIGTMYANGPSGFVGAFMESDAGYGEMFVTDGSGNTQIYAKGDVNQLMFRNSSSATAPPSGYAALRASSGDPYWYDAGGLSWERLAYYDDVAKLGVAQNWTANQTFVSSDLLFTGTSLIYIGGTFFVDSSKNVSAGNVSATGYVAAGSYFNTSAGDYRVGGTPVITSGRGGVFTSVAISAFEVINSSGVGNFNGLKINGTEVINTSRQFVGDGVVCTGGALGGQAINIYQSGWYYGVTGPTTFTSADGKTITVRGGAVVSIV